MMQNPKVRPVRPQVEDPFITENKELILNLLQDAEDIYTVVKRNMKNDQEPKFFKENRGYPITLHLIDGRTIEGVLDDIRNYIIIIDVDNNKRYYFKHSLEGYTIDQQRHDVPGSDAQSA